MPGNSEESLPEVFGEEEMVEERGFRTGVGDALPRGSEVWEVPVDFLLGFCSWEKHVDQHDTATSLERSIVQYLRHFPV